MPRIQVTFSRLTVAVELDDSRTAKLLYQALPFESVAKRWGDEVYFETPVAAGEEAPQDDVPPGTVAYWPAGKALCLFFGQRPYSPVNVVGKFEGQPAALASVADGEAVRVEAL